MIWLLFLLNQTIEFYADPVVFRSKFIIEDTVNHTRRTETIYYLEMNCAVPYHQLRYETIDDQNVARAVLFFDLHNLDRPDSLLDTLHLQFAIQSFEQAAREQTQFITQFGMHVPAGNFDIVLRIQSGERTGTVRKTIAIEPGKYHISDILVASGIYPDTTQDYLRKGNIVVVPHPSHSFNDQYRNIFLYYELYDIEPDSGEFSISYRILNQAGDTIREISQKMKRLFNSLAVNAGISINELPAGEYRLTVELPDSPATWTYVKSTDFSIVRSTVVDTAVSYANMPYYEKIEYFLTGKEYKKFQKLPPEGKKIYLDRFWSDHDYPAIAERFDYATRHYQEGNKAGWQTDRGRIYIKCGAPDEIEKSFIEVKESKPYETWTYFNGWEFIFSDIRGTQEYLLVWTNFAGERPQPTLYRYLPESIRRDIQ